MKSNNVYIVLLNDEKQYSIWDANKTLPNGWVATDVRGDEQTCLDYIESVWTDLRPFSARQP